MPFPMKGTTSKLRRTPNACIPCRRSKIKCSGRDPCANCQRRSLRCQFSDENSKVLVAERYLRDLQNEIKQLRRSLVARRSGDLSFELDTSTDGGIHSEDGSLRPAISVSPSKENHASQINEFPCNIWTSPFTLPTSVIMDQRHSNRADKRNWIWLAPASPWSFTARLTVMMTERLGLSLETNGSDIYLDGDIYPLDWNSEQSYGTVADLPSLDYALHLYNVAKLHLGQRYRFLDEDTFTAQMTSFYNSRQEGEITQPRMWFVQFLLILAFGKALVSRPNGNTPPGSKFFLRAMSILPSNTKTGKDSLMVIETLALAALYLYSVDHRESSHLHIGQAMRIAQLEGLHTELPEAALGTDTIHRCQSIWWTLYILDRQVSFALGLPMITQDCDISTAIRDPCDQSQVMVFNLQVKLSQMLSSILSTIYQTEKTQLGAFLEKTKSILQTMAGLAEEIEAMIPGRFQGMDSVSQETRHIFLLYHQCVIIATRPLLLSVLKERLEKLGRAEENWQGFLALPKSLISIGIKSALKILHILSDESIILEVFLPFDLELCYAAAIHLTMGNTLFPPETETDSYSNLAHQILDEMISRGNKVATIRKSELNRLERLFETLDHRVRQEGLQTLTISGLGEPSMDLEECASVQLALTPKDLSLPPVDPQIEAADLDLLGDLGISSFEFWSIIGQIGSVDPGGSLRSVGSEAWFEDGSSAAFE